MLAQKKQALVDFAPGSLIPRVREHLCRMQSAPKDYTYTPRRFFATVVLRRVSEEAEKKAAKPPRYAGTILLLHVNMPAEPEEVRKFISGAPSAVKSATHVYRSIWTLHDQQIFRCHPFYGDPASLAPKPVRTMISESYTMSYTSVSPTFGMSSRRQAICQVFCQTVFTSRSCQSLL